MSSFIVAELDSGKRLDRYLVEQLPGQSRSQIQKQIEAGHITVNGKKVTKHHFLSSGDAITIDTASVEKPTLVTQPIDIPILYEDETILVLEKPVGVLVHPVPGREQWTLSNFLHTHIPRIEEVGDDQSRPGIVHRLDKDVSGVLIVAKTTEAFNHLKSQFQKRTVQKEYRAIVHGIPAEQSGEIRFVIARSSTHPGKMAARPEHAEGRDAWTEYDVLRTKNKRYAELVIRIRTGRTHQIRAHMAAISHPVVGDKLYATKQYQDTKVVYPRLFLHAHRLGIQHPQTEESMEFISPIPQEFEAFMQEGQPS